MQCRPVLASRSDGLCCGRRPLSHGRTPSPPSGPFPSCLPSLNRQLVLVQVFSEIVTQRQQIWGQGERGAGHSQQAVYSGHSLEAGRWANGAQGPPPQPTMHGPNRARPHRPAALPCSGTTGTGKHSCLQGSVSPSRTSPLTLGLFPQHLVQQEVREVLHDLWAWVIWVRQELWGAHMSPHPLGRRGRRGEWAWMHSNTGTV